jgi:hypothetical protein
MLHCLLYCSDDNSYMNRAFLLTFAIIENQQPNPVSCPDLSFS